MIEHAKDPTFFKIRYPRNINNAYPQTFSNGSIENSTRFSIQFTMDFSFNE